ncbi:MAG: hypothetical protein ABI348_11050 [Nitrososphaera sp.]
MSSEIRLHIDGRELPLLEAAKYVAEKLPKEEKRSVLHAVAELEILEQQIKHGQRVLEQSRIRMAHLIQEMNQKDSSKPF